MAAVAARHDVDHHGGQFNEEAEAEAWPAEPLGQSSWRSKIIGTGMHVWSTEGQRRMHRFSGTTTKNVGRQVGQVLKPTETQSQRPNGKGILEMERLMMIP